MMNDELVPEEHPDIKPLVLNKPQLRFVLNQPKEATNLWSRATGKSSLIAWLMHLIATKMPRASWALVGQTYMQILTRTLPSTVASLERIGYIQDRHYVIGKRPPRYWDLPYEPPVKNYDHYLTFRSGAGFHLVSLDKVSSRGLNIDGVITDESLLLDKERFDAEVVATNRGNLRYFKGVPLHHGIYHFTSMPHTSGGKWLLDTGDYYEKERPSDPYDFTELRNRLIKLQLQFVDNKDRKARLELWPKMQALEKEIVFYKSKKGLLYSEANVFDNITNVGLRYIEQQRRVLLDHIFQIELLNLRPLKVQGGFYPYLDTERHVYTSFNNSYLENLGYGNAQLLHINSLFDQDCNPLKPLRIAVDWGSKINCMSVGQEKPEGLFVAGKQMPPGFYFLKSLYVKHPQILDDLAMAFCNYYRPNLCKEVHFCYDHTGNTQMANSNITYAEQFAKILRSEGWTVYFVTDGAPPTHQEKYLLWCRLLKGEEARLPWIGFNKENCKYLLISMQNAPAKDGPRGIEKNKSSERSSAINQEEATHFSDTGDILVTSLYKDVLQEMPAFVDIIR